jgi:ATP-dependent exoDNAse (exonuclease V) beta subunit
MITTYLRSSSIITHNQCEMKYFGEYILNIKGEPRQKTVMGSMFHKVMEGLALQKKARQDNKKKFTPSEIGSFPIGCSITNLIDASYDYYAKRHADFSWENKQKKDLTNWVNSVIILEQGEFNPANLNVLDVEKYFDIQIKEDWAKYKYNLNGPVEGYLSLKGTIDLIVDQGDHIELIDWKTGQRKNWLTGKIKEYEDFRDDKQLLLYYYVAHHLYDKPITMTIVYVNQGGSYTMDFSQDDYQRARGDG